MTYPGVRSPRRVLLVEDHDVLAEAIVGLLQACGLEVRVASTGREALEATPFFQPEIVLCDLTLPDMNGLEVARALRAMPGGANLVIAVHTAMPDSFAHELEGPAAGVVDRIVPKPITAPTLDALLSLVRERGPQGRAARM